MIISQYTVTRGPFGASFSTDQRIAMVDDYVVYGELESFKQLLRHIDFN